MQGWDDERLGGNAAEPTSALYAGNLAPEVDDATLAEAFSSCGAVSAVVWREPSTGQSLGNGSVRFSSPDEARFALETLTGRLLCGRPLELRFAAVERPPAGHTAHGGQYPSAPSAGVDGAGGDIGPSPNLYIKGLPPGTTDVGLRNVFSPFGTIVDSRVLYPQSAAPSALLRYTAVHEAAAAIAAMHNVTPPGATNALQVRYAESQADKARRATRPAPGDMPGPRGPPPLPAGAEAVERVECPHSLVGWLIGRGGETIRGLQTRSGSGISIDQNLPEGVPRIVVITGNREQVALGKQLVEELLVSGAARGGGTWPGGGGGGGTMPGGGAGATGGVPQWGGRNDHGPGQQQQQMQAPQAAVHSTGPAMQPGYAAPNNRTMAQEAAEEPEPEPPTFDAEYVAAAKAAAAESAADLPSELRLVDSPLQHLATLAARRAGSAVPVPRKPGSHAHAIVISALRELCSASQRGTAPPQALLSALTEASTLLATEGDWVFGVSHAGTEVTFDETEETNIARAVVACVSHLAAPTFFARYACDAKRNAAFGVAGVSAAGLLCVDERRSVRFFSAGGAVVLASVASQSGTPECIRVAAVQALARATRFASACVFVLEEWRCEDALPHEAPLATVARLLLSPQRAKFAQYAVTVLTHCHVCRLAWHVRAAAADGASCKDEVEALTLLLHQQRNSNAVPALSLDTSTRSASESASVPSEASTLGLLADARILPSLAAAVRRAGDGAQASAGSLVRELASSLHGLYVLASEAAAAVDLAGSADGDAAPLIRAGLLGVTALEALLHSDADVGLLGALHCLARLSRDAVSRDCAALLLAAPGSLDRLLDVLAAPPVPTAPNDPFSLTHGLALELLLTLLSDGRVEALSSWVPHVRRISKAVEKLESVTSSVTWSLVREWLAAGLRLHERGNAGLLTWLHALVLNGDSGAPSATDAAPAPSGTTPDAQPAVGAAAFAPLSAGSRIGVLCTLRLLSYAARSSHDEAVTLFGMDALGVIAVLLRRSSDVLACCGASSADDPAALEEDLDAGPAVAACRRFIRVAAICAAAAQLAHPLLQRLREGGVAEYRSSVLVGALSAAHAAAAVQHAAGGPLCAAAYAVRVECASALAFWATGAQAWQPRALQLELGEAGMTPRAALARALLIVDLLPPVGHPGRLSEEALVQLLADVPPAALAALLQAAASSTSARLNAVAVQALARVASLGEKHTASVAEACVEASATLPEGDSVPGQLSHALRMLTGVADATDAAEVASALRARLSSAAVDVSLFLTTDSLPVSYGSAHFPASLEAVFLSADRQPVSWRIPRDGLRFADDAAKRKRIVRAEARAKRSKTSAGAALRNAEAVQPPPQRRKLASGAGRTMHVDEFQARQAALKGIPAAEAAPQVPPPPPAAATPLPATVHAAAAAPKMLSIKFGAPSSAPAAAVPIAPAAPVATTAVAEAIAPSMLDQWEPEGALEFTGQPHSEEPAPQPSAVAPAPFEHAPPPSSFAPMSVIPGLGGFSAAPAAATVIPGLGFAAAPPPVLVAPRVPVPPPQPPPRPPPQQVAVPLPQPPAGPPPVRPPQPPAGAPPQLQQGWTQQAPPQQQGWPQQGWPQQAQPAHAAAWEQQQPAVPVQPSALLMQQLSSPDAIQQLLNDPTRLAALLTQFPALATMLQERLHATGPR